MDDDVESIWEEKVVAEQISFSVLWMERLTKSTKAPI
jgi:hypothetical protein